MKQKERSITAESDSVSLIKTVTVPCQDDVYRPWDANLDPVMKATEGKISERGEGTFIGNSGTFCLPHLEAREGIGREGPVENDRNRCKYRRFGQICRLKHKEIGIAAE